LKTLETVAGETPASLATSRTLGFFLFIFSNPFYGFFRTVVIPFNKQRKPFHKSLYNINFEFPNRIFLLEKDLGGFIYE
jgi:hypothetical protein